MGRAPQILPTNTDKISTRQEKALKTQTTEKFEEQKNKIKDEQNTSTGASIFEHKNEQNPMPPHRILPTDTDKISATQESREIKEELGSTNPQTYVCLKHPAWATRLDPGSTNETPSVFIMIFCNRGLKNQL